MYLLGAHLPDQKLVRVSILCSMRSKVYITNIFFLLQIALTSFYGISHETARRLCARLQLHEAATVSSLNDSQVNILSAYLSSPGSVSAQKPSPTSPILGQAGSSNLIETNPSSSIPPSQRLSPSNDPLRSIVIESDLKRQIQGNIGHHRTIGTYRGRRHLQGLPVRGQKTRTNALTAKRLNKIGRSMSTLARPRELPSMSSSLIMSLVESLGSLRFPSQQNTKAEILFVFWQLGQCKAQSCNDSPFIHLSHLLREESA